MLEGCNDILAESWGKNILLCTELVPGLSDDGVDDVQSRNFVFWFALLKRRTGVSTRPSLN